MIEEWRDIPGFEGYQVSSLGRIKSFKKYTQGYIMKQSNDKDGYKKVTLTKDGKEYTRRVHLLVAKAFIPNPQNKPIINHKNGIKYDNRVENLEWVTISENTQHAFDNKINKNIGANHPKAQKCEVYINNELIACYSNTFAIEYALKTHRSIINWHIKNHKLLFGKFKIIKVNKFNKVVNLNTDIGILKNKGEKIENPIAIYNTSMELLAIYPSLSACERITGFSRKTLALKIKNNQPYKNKYYIKQITIFEFLTTDTNKRNLPIGNTVK